jgi:hypothetical protein
MSARWRRVSRPLGLMAAWLAAGVLMFRFLDGLEWLDALLSAFYLETAGDPFSQGYLFWGQAVVLGVVVWIVVGERLASRVEAPR